MAERGWCAGCRRDRSGGTRRFARRGRRAFAPRRSGARSPGREAGSGRASGAWTRGRVPPPPPAFPRPRAGERSRRRRARGNARTDPVALEAVDALENAGVGQALRDLERDLVPAGLVHLAERRARWGVRSVGGRFQVEAERGQGCRTDAVGFVHSLRVLGCARNDGREDSIHYIMNQAPWRLPERPAGAGNPC